MASTYRHLKAMKETVAKTQGSAASREGWKPGESGLGEDPSGAAD